MDDTTTDSVSSREINADQLAEWLQEVRDQPTWRYEADREMDYCDGNQLDSDILRQQEELGIPPAIENVMGPCFDSILGMEAKQKKDFRVLPYNDKQGDDVAMALGHKLLQAEQRSGLDRACSDAYDPQIKCGVGWVEVTRDSDPFRFPYRARSIHRNEIVWDMRAREHDLMDARYLIRRKWLPIEVAAGMFQKHAELIRRAGNGWRGYDAEYLTTDGGTVPDLSRRYEQERGWSIEEAEWRNVYNNTVCLFEVHYHVWDRALVLKTPGGRVVEVDQANPMHLSALASGMPVEFAQVTRARVAWFVGPHKLYDGPGKKNGRFPYVLFCGKREDRTGVPYGLARGMMYLQDEVNARISKMQWLLSATMTERTEGAVAMSDEQFRNEISRPDADVILNREEMANGGVFKVHRDYQLTQQQAERLADAREAIKRAGGITAAFAGEVSRDLSTSSISSQIEQSVQGLADINDNFIESRKMCGELLLDLILEDMQGVEEQVIIPGNALKEDRLVALNARRPDGLLDNDTERTKLLVVLNDVPSTPSYRAQQLAAFSESFKSLPAEAQMVALPHLMSLMDIPEKEEIIKALREMQQQSTPEQIEERIQQEVEAALMKAGISLKEREMNLKERKAELEERMLVEKISDIVATTVNKRIESIYSAVQGGMQIASAPMVAPIADQVLKSAGFVDADQAPIVAPGEQMVQAEPPRENTSPMFPPRAQDVQEVGPEVAETEQPESSWEGAMRGIEAQGVQG